MLALPLQHKCGLLGALKSFRNIFDSIGNVRRISLPRNMIYAIGYTAAAEYNTYAFCIRLI